MQVRRDTWHDYIAECCSVFAAAYHAGAARSGEQANCPPYAKQPYAVFICEVTEDVMLQAGTIAVYVPVPQTTADRFVGRAMVLCSSSIHVYLCKGTPNRTQHPGVYTALRRRCKTMTSNDIEINLKLVS